MSRSFRLGLFLLTTLAILAACVFLVGREESKFGSNYQVRSDFQNVAGLSVGADVRVGGIRKGTVRSIRLPKTPDGQVVVTMDLAKETQADRQAGFGCVDSIRRSSGRQIRRGFLRFGGRGATQERPDD